MKASVLEDGVSVISRSVLAENGKELMASKTLATFLAKKEEEYDRVIVNATGSERMCGCLCSGTAL